MHNVTHKHKLFLNIHTQRDIWYLPLNYYWGGGGGGGEHNTLKAPMCYYSLGKLCSEKYSREPATAVL